MKREESTNHHEQWHVERIYPSVQDRRAIHSNQ